MFPERLTKIAYQQDGLVTRAQALAVGAGRDAIRYAISPKGRWQRVLPGIYATFTGPLGELHKLRAAVLYGGDGAMITGSHACELHGMEYVPVSDTIDVLVAHRCQRLDVDFVRLRRTRQLPAAAYWIGADLPDQDIGELLSAQPEDSNELVHGAVRWKIPMAPLSRAAMDAVRFRQLTVVDGQARGLKQQARTLLIRDTRALLCEVVQRRRVQVGQLAAELSAAPTAGTAIARLAMGDVVAGCRSAPECELRDLVKKSKILPEPRWNLPLPVPVAGRSRGGRQSPPVGRPAARQYPTIYPDACWPEARLVVEVNSVRYHRIGLTQEQTEKRQTLYAELGWLVISVSPYRIRTDPAEVLQQIERAYVAGLAGRR